MNNIFIEGNDFNIVYKNLLERLLDDRSVVSNRKGEQLSEMINASFEITDPRNCFAVCRGMSTKYLEGELHFYLSGSEFLSDIVKYSKFWEKCSDDGEKINSNYGKLLLYDRNDWGYTQFQYALDMLIRNQESKKAVMTIYAPTNAYKSLDNPCTMYLQFFIRNGKLSLYVKMRSSDIWFGLPYDVPFFVMIQFMMQQELRRRGTIVEIGVYNHTSGSLHLYDRNVEKALLISDNPIEETESQEEMFERYIMKALRRWYSGEYSNR